MPGTTESPRAGPPGFWRILRRRRAVLLLTWAGTLALGTGAAFLIPASVSSHVTLLFERPPATPGAPGVPSPKDQAEIMRQHVQNDDFLRRILARSGLLLDPETRAWAARSASPDRGRASDQRIEAFLVDHLRRSIAIEPIPGSAFRIRVDDPVPDRARRLADAVAAQFVESARAAQLEAVRTAQELSLEQHRLFKRRLEESERRLEAFRNGSTEEPVGSRITQADVTRARSLLEQTVLDVEQRRRRVAELRARVADPRRIEEASGLANGGIQALVGQVKGLERQRLAALVSNDPTGDGGALARQAMARKLSELEVQLIHTAAIELRSASPELRDLLVRYRLAETELEAAEAGRAYLGEQVGRYERLGTLPADPETELRRLTEDVESNRALYNTYLQEVAASRISQSFESAQLGGRFRVPGPASLPRLPLVPRRVGIVLLSLVIGGILGIAAVGLAEHRDPSVKNAFEVESLLGLPVLGAVPRVEDLERRRRTRGQPVRLQTPGSEPGLLQRLKAESPLGIEFRRIYLRLAQDRHGLPGTLLVTSSTRGEGKTLTAACLAITIARELREEVLLVDFDLRSPALHRALGLPVSSWGLSQILQQQKFDARFVRSTVVPSLDFLPAGRSERPAAELLTPEAILWFIGAVRPHYACVLFDAAPSLAVPDSLILGGGVDGVLYVVKAGTTVRKAAEFGVKVQREARDNILGVRGQRRRGIPASLLWLPGRLRESIRGRRGRLLSRGCAMYPCHGWVSVRFVPCRFGGG